MSLIDDAKLRTNPDVRIGFRKPCPNILQVAPNYSEWLRKARLKRQNHCPDSGHRFQAQKKHQNHFLILMLDCGSRTQCLARYQQPTNSTRCQKKKARPESLTDKHQQIKPLFDIKSILKQKEFSFFYAIRCIIRKKRLRLQL
jgi:hypothetical protein